MATASETATQIAVSPAMQIVRFSLIIFNIIFLVRQCSFVIFALSVGFMSMPSVFCMSQYKPHAVVHSKPNKRTFIIISFGLMAEHVQMKRTSR